jgi:hypothetical protein
MRGLRGLRNDGPRGLPAVPHGPVSRWVAGGCDMNLELYLFILCMGMVIGWVIVAV